MGSQIFTVFSHWCSLYLQEGMLNQLQLHVEQEEIKWRQQIKSLETQLQQYQDGSQDGDSDSNKKVLANNDSAVLQVWATICLPFDP